MTDFKVGDRVRVTFEGIVQSDNHLYVALYTPGSQWAMEFRKDKGVQVEVIESPEKPFKPGEVVRSKHTGNTYTLTNDGYVSHSTGKVWNDGAGWRDSTFTTKHYELVEV